MKFYIGITTSRSFALSTWVLFVSIMQSVNTVQFLNITPLFLLSPFRYAASAPIPVIAIFPFASMYASL